ncbi:MAG TPA: adenylate cyclase regulatory domain-containing protein [Actinomycetota bacterium]|nr:adenylate cyclase regulatory domain-containing protein [Actinomycetota bacterium]
MGDRLSRERLADRSGVDPEYVDRLVSLGILTVPVDGTFAGSACQVVRLVRSFDGSGITPEHIGEAVRTGQLSLAFLDQPGYERFSGLSDTTFQEVSERSGIPLNVLTMTREAIGYGMAAPGDRMRDDELEAVPLIQLTHERGFEAEVLERLLRVYGESLRRVVETESASYRSQVLGPLLASGLSEFDALQRASRFTGEVFELLDRAIMGIYHGQQEHSWMRTIFETVEDGLDRAGVRSKVERPPAMCFVDLAGYTKLTEEHGDAAAAATAVTLAPLVGRIASGHGGSPVKWLGDGVMLHFADPGEAVVAALDIADELPAAGLPPMHAGIDAGPVIFQDGDYFGRTVNIAARIAAHAKTGEVLVSDAVLGASTTTAVAFHPLGPADLKGVARSVLLHRAERASPLSSGIG